MKTVNTLPHRSHRVSRSLGLVSLGLFAALSTACSDAGANSTSSSGNPNPGNLLQVEFALRQDFRFANSSLGDAALLDIDGDGVEDLIESSLDPPTVPGGAADGFVGISYGVSTGGFLQQVQLPTVGRGWTLTVTDLDANGLLDIAVCCRNFNGSGANAVQVFPQGPNPRDFGATSNVTLASDPFDIVAAPLSGQDGGTDPTELFVAVRDSLEIARMSLDGAGELQQTGTLVSTNSVNGSSAGSGAPYSVAVIDIGDNGLLDIIAGEEYVDGGGPGRLVAYTRTNSPDIAEPPVEVLSGLGKPIARNAGDVDGNGFDDVSIAQLTATNGILIPADMTGISGSNAISIDFGGATSSLLFADLGNDGFADAMGTVLFQTAVQVHPSNGANFVWGDPSHYNVGVAPRALAVGMLPGDALPDLFCSNSASASILMGVGNTTLPSGAQKPLLRAAEGYPSDVLLEGPVYVQSADLNNDGDIDAVAVTVRQEAVSFMQGAGDGSLEARTVLPLAPTQLDQQGYLQIADMDQDGFLDVLTTVHARSEVKVYINQLTANGGNLEDAFTDAGSFVVGVGNGVLGIEVADFTGDLMPDALVANQLDGTIQVLRNTGGTPLLLAEDPITIPEIPSPRGPVSADFDNDIDGTMDVAIYAGDGNSPEQFFIGILEGDGSGGFTWVENHDIDGPCNNLALGDLDKNSFIDVVVGQTLTSGDVLFILDNEGNTDEPNFSSRPLVISPGPGSPIVADANNDTNLDILVPTSQGELKIAFGDGTGDFPIIDPPMRGDAPTPRGTLAAAYADLNGDGLPEILMAAHTAPFVWVALNVSIPIPTQ